MKKYKRLPKLLAEHLSRIIVIIMAVILILSISLQLISSFNKVRSDAEMIFAQLEVILDRNDEEIEQIKQDYSESCLRNAKAIAFGLKDKPDIISDREALIKYAALMGVDEIHIFNTDGVIVYGTHKEYYGYSFDSGEQMNFFKPMLSDKNLGLVQEVLPNTAEGKMVQYSAVWSDDGEFIVEIGMYPVKLENLMKKNELSYIFSQLLINGSANVYSYDSHSCELLATTDETEIGSTGKAFSKSIRGEYFGDGRVIDEIVRAGNGFYYVCCKKIHDEVMVYAFPVKKIFLDMAVSIMLFLLGEIIMSLILVRSVSRHMKKYVVDSANSLNDGLKKITDGELETVVNVHSCQEFFEISNHINSMVKSLLDNIDKLSYILEKSDVAIGVYEYGNNSSTVRFTTYVKDVLKLDGSKSVVPKAEFMRAIDRFKMSALVESPDVYEVRVPVENNVTKIVYIHFEENVRDDDTFGIITDVTKQILERRRIEMERDMDLLTGLYNRRGLENRLEALRNNDKVVKYCALIMVDADCLKETNDMYGHAIGDMYLKKIADTISSIGTKESISARLGGDEYVLFLYGYNSEDAVKEDIKTLYEKQDIPEVDIADELSIPVKFSVGYCISKGCYDIEGMTERADEDMYENKRSRKGDNIR